MKPLQSILLAVLLCCFGSFAGAQVSPSAMAPIVIRASADRDSILFNNGYTLRRNVQEAQVRFVATDRMGRPVLGLRPEDVQVFDDQLPVAQLKSFTPAEYDPLEVGVVVDLSESIGARQHAQTLAAADMLSEVFDSKRDEAFVVGFATKSRLLQPATTDIGLVRAALQQNGERHGLTSLFDAVVSTCRDDFGEARDGRRRILLLFSDGADTLSMHGVYDAIEEALHAHVTVYAVTTRKDETGFRNLQRLTEGTGGRLYLLSGKRDLTLLAADMSQSLRGQYTITFRPATETAGFHKVRVRVPGRQEVVLQANSGYFLEP